MDVLFVGNESLHAQIYMKKLTQACMEKEIEMQISMTSPTILKKADVILLSPRAAYLAQVMERNLQLSSCVLAIHHFDYASLNPMPIVEKLYSVFTNI